MAQIRAVFFDVGEAIVDESRVYGAEAILRSLGLPVDVIGTSEGWGVEKPSPEFFARVVEATGAAPHEVAYVGDRLDNDVLPALDAGLVAVRIRRGPWGHLQVGADGGALRIRSLDELPEAFDRA